jgi:MerR family redox-sensitive transcriptional activator SoxR
MSILTISEVARAVGLRPSAIRYYEQIGVVPRATRVNGQRRYDERALHRLVVVQRARQLDFSLDDIRRLFFAFRQAAPPSQRWRELSQRKLQELALLAESIQTLQALLRSQGQCSCTSLEECGRCLLESGIAGAAPPPAKRLKRST